VGAKETRPNYYNKIASDSQLREETISPGEEVLGGRNIWLNYSA